MLSKATYADQFGSEKHHGFILWLLIWTGNMMCWKQKQYSATRTGEKETQIVLSYTINT